MYLCLSVTESREVKMLLSLGYRDKKEDSEKEEKRWRGRQGNLCLNRRGPISRLPVFDLNGLLRLQLQHCLLKHCLNIVTSPGISQSP